VPLRGEYLANHLQKVALQKYDGSLPSRVVTLKYVFFLPEIKYFDATVGKSSPLYSVNFVLIILSLIEVRVIKLCRKSKVEGRKLLNELHLFEGCIACTYSAIVYRGCCYKYIEERTNKTQLVYLNTKKTYSSSSNSKTSLTGLPNNNDNFKAKRLMEQIDFFN
jgi:hypothetical protein